MRELALFAGVGGGLLGTHHLLGWRTVCAVEIEPYRVDLLGARQRDGFLGSCPFPIHRDVHDFDGTAWRGRVDVVSAGFPCPPFSVAGKGLGAGDPGNMWPDTARVIREVGPRFVLLENVPGLLAHQYFGSILGDLAESGFDAEWDCFPASAIGAPHQRDRLWILAYSPESRREDRPGRPGWPTPIGRRGWTSVEFERPSGRSRGWRPGSADDMADADSEERGTARRGSQPGSDKGDDVTRRGTEGGRPLGAEVGTVPYSDSIDADHSGHGASTLQRERWEAARLRGGLPDADGIEAGQSRRWSRPHRKTPAESGFDGSTEPVADADGERRDEGDRDNFREGGPLPANRRGWPPEPRLGRIAPHGMADRVVRVEAIGDGQVPGVAALAWTALARRAGIDL